jgi:hypothetical protein
LIEYRAIVKLREIEGLSSFLSIGRAKAETVLKLNTKRRGRTIVVAVGGATVTTAVFTWQGKTDVTIVLLLLFVLKAIIMGGLFMRRLALAS